ncbi:MAG: DNA-3-methyladenine glycosylase I [uncultured DHVE6 group euryarchaeote]|jgi:DNA-3-methyladenine glycosylase I|nr:MAG: DNA-3-methyladenine glycosylase I [uncultured DHVE6 group euryarchaeote]
MKTRCKWLDLTKEDYIKYHDKDWGVQEHNDRKLFAKLILDGAQAGLSWYTILRKRDNYRKAFDNWDYKKIAKYDSNKELELLKNEGIVRNKLKIKSAIKNAQTFIKIREEFGSFDNYLWGFVNYKQIINKFKSVDEIPSKTELSDKISKDLKKRGMNFVGSTIIYAFMQAVGMVNDHQVDCFRYKEVQ